MVKENDSQPSLLFICGLTRVPLCTKAVYKRYGLHSFRFLKYSRRCLVNCSLTHRQLFSVAPMMDVTDKHFRNLARMISKHAVLYTEMIVDNVIIHSDGEKRRRILDFDSAQRPLCLQIGGSDPSKVSKAVHIAHKYFRYDDYNLNCGCPSDKVSSQGCFGAILMKQPEKVARITSRVAETVGKPMTVKCRIGVDHHDSYEFLSNFIHVVSTSGHVNHFIIHARSAWLSGLSPKENRSKPPIKYEYVYRLTKDFPHLKFTLNGQVSTLSDVVMHLSKGVEGVMLGRAVMERPWSSLRLVDCIIYNDFSTLIRRKYVVQKYLEHIAQYEGHASRYLLVKPVLQLFAGEMNCRIFRARCGECLQQGHSASDSIRYALNILPQSVLEQESWNSEELLAFKDIQERVTVAN
ncbi:tRNA-dihydrouridine(20/20a) synthase [Galdieria sulphuraria]|nr:tRNA-dihydrouridine(20/20a) synthase [Galdieria sulphuraria]